MNKFQNNNGLKPSQIVVYRDGVSETEYKKVMTEELVSRFRLLCFTAGLLS